jgi:Kef-type K+ transport system membrane component KefB
VMALVSEMRSEGSVTRFILASVVVADLVVILCYAVAAAVAGSMVGAEVSFLESFAQVSWEMFGSVGFGLLVGGLLGQFLTHIGKGVSLFSLVVCVVVAEIGSRIHLDPLIVMLTAGLWLRNFARAKPDALFHELESSSLPVFLVFFALAGAKIDLAALYASLIPVVILVLARVGSFYVGGRVATATRDVDPGVRRYGWFGLIPQAGLALALALLVQRSFSFGDQAAAILFGVVATNELIAPVILRVVLLRTGEAGKRSGADFAADH